VVAASVEAGGLIGEHPAPVDQLLVLLAGRAIVTGGDGQHQEVTPGKGVLWVAHESHRTDALTDISVLIIEGEGLAEVMSPRS
jgi:quercetin dioxygenase-like cupin family protein